MKSITDINDTSPFFKLPREIRDQIYGLVLAGRVLKPFPIRSGYPFSEPEEIRANHIAVGFLRTSRWIYHEASPLLCGANTFSFLGVEALIRFVRLLKPVEQRAVHSIVLRLPINSTKALNLTTIRALSGLRRLHVDLELYFRTFTYGPFFVKAYVQAHSKLPNGAAAKSLHVLSRCPLTHVRVEVFRGHASYSGDLIFDWTGADMQKMAICVEQDLLSDWDEDKYQKEQALKQKEQALKRDRALKDKKALVEQYRLRGLEDAALDLEAQIRKSEKREARLKASRDKRTEVQESAS
ncbi:hypothetical protein EJ08DRAFT_702609 [Tothia fuscella]|uniref:Uncharacterized protein n=1 Tax=Tothia fuscella TaxID=1048955 RepID=A0A9P4NGA1_9PEZI|nr:hypothetical protein EJ08DRAFT_702609 [Tothia fuscella]